MLMFYKGVYEGIFYGEPSFLSHLFRPRAGFLLIHYAYIKIIPVVYFPMFPGGRYRVFFLFFTFSARILIDCRRMK